MITLRTYPFKMIFKKYIYLFLKKIKNFFQPKAKFRIIVRNNKFVAQQFFGYWKFGGYLDLSHTSEEPFLHFTFEHNNIGDAEMVIEKAMKEYKTKSFIIKEYDEN